MVSVSDHSLQSVVEIEEWGKGGQRFGLRLGSAGVPRSRGERDGMSASMSVSVSKSMTIFEKDKISCA